MCDPIVALVSIIIEPTKSCTMLKQLFLLLPILTSACAQLPEKDSGAENMVDVGSFLTWVVPRDGQTESTHWSLCDTQKSRQACHGKNAGLQATGLGGLFLPLKVSLSDLSFGADRSRIGVAINGRDAICTNGLLASSDSHAFIEIHDVFCNWLLIGNVISSLKLTIDWIDPASYTFGGRYSVRFIGTGNGAGAGFYTAKERP